MGFIHSRNVYKKEVITFNKLWEECTQDEARIIIREKKMGETEDQALTIQRRTLMRNMKNSTLEEPFIHINHLDKK